MIEVNQLHKQYDPPNGAMAVDGISFVIRRGEIFSLLGPNGAGKTTTVSMLSCLLRPTSGDALVDGHSITSAPNQVKQVIGVVPQDIALYSAISARENLAFWGRMYGLGGQKLKERISAVLEIVELTDRADEKVETFSGGMKRRLNIAAGLLHEPKIVYMDEPTVGVDPQSRRRILDTIKALKEQGLTVLYTTHYMEEAEELSDRIGIMDGGKLTAIGTQEELTRMVAPYDTIQLELIRNGQDPKKSTNALAKLPGVHQASYEADCVVLQASKAHEVLPFMMTYINEVGMQLKRLEIQEPNLELVFLQLTGRALRD